MVFSNLFEMEEEDNQFDEDHRDAFDEMDEGRGPGEGRP